MGGAEEVQPDDIFRSLRGTGNRIDIQRRGVRRQNSARLADRIEFFEHLLLDREVLEYCFDDEIGITQVVVFVRGFQATDTVDHFVLADLAALNAALVQTVNRRHAPLQSLLVVIEQAHGISGVQAVVCDTGAHRSGAQYGNGVYCSYIRVLVDTGHPGNCALGKEGVTQAVRLRRVLAFREQLALGFQALLEIDPGRHLDQIDDLLR